VVLVKDGQCGILYWSRILADLKHERTRAIQPPLWPEEETKEEN
jgi:hypothetical protein